MNYSAVVVGCGNIGSRYDHNRESPELPLSHAGAYHTNPIFDLVGVAEVDAARRAECQQRWGVPLAVADFRELFVRIRPDIVSIATPSVIRLPIVEAAIAAEARAIWCEKPLANSVAEGEEIVRLCENAGVVLTVNYLRRWEPACRAVAGLLKRGDYGPLQKIIGVYVRGLNNNGGHLIDLVRWWGGDVTSVEHVREYCPGSPDVTFVCSAKTPVHFYALAGDAYDVFELDVFCQTGRVRLLDFGDVVQIQAAKQSLDFPKHTFLGEPEYLESNLDACMLLALEDIAHCIKKGGQPACTGRDGLGVLQAFKLVDDFDENPVDSTLVGERIE